MSPKGGRRKGGRGGVPTVEVLVEEESATEALRPLLEKVLDGCDARFGVRHFRGKPDLLKKLPARLAGYAAARRRGEDIRVVVLIDQDQQDCGELKKELDRHARAAGLVPRGGLGPDGTFEVLNRIAMRELESWYFGDWAAVREAFPRVTQDVPRPYRGNPDAVGGKCSDAFEKVLYAHGVRLASKPEWGRRVGPRLSLTANRSPSFRAFVTGVREIATAPSADH